MNPVGVTGILSGSKTNLVQEAFICDRATPGQRQQRRYFEFENGCSLIRDVLQDGSFSTWQQIEKFELI